MLAEVEEEKIESWIKEMRKGYIKLVVLMFLNEEAMSGYDIMKRIEEATLGFWRLTSGGIYPVLKELERKGYIKLVSFNKGGRKKKIYAITENGKRILKYALEKQQKMEEIIGGMFREFAGNILENVEPSFSPKVFSFSSSMRSLKHKTPNEQKRLLMSIRTDLLNAIKIVDKKLEQIERESKNK